MSKVTNIGIHMNFAKAIEYSDYPNFLTVVEKAKLPANSLPTSTHINTVIGNQYLTQIMQ